MLRTLVLATGVSSIAIIGLFFITGSSLPTQTIDWVVLLGLSVFGAGVFLVLAAALEAGPVSIVSPIIAAYASVVVLLALVLHGEVLAPLEVAGVVGAIGGVILASTDLRRVPRHIALVEAPVPADGEPPSDEAYASDRPPPRTSVASGAQPRRRLGRGPALAVVAFLAIGVVTFYSGVYAQRLGWVVPTLVGRLTLLAIYAGSAAVRGTSFKDVPLKLLVVGSVVGMVEMSGFLSFSRGAEVGLISIVAAVSALAPLITLVLGIWLLRERPAPNQLVGSLVVVVAVVTLGLSN